MVFTQTTLSAGHLHRSAWALGLEDSFRVQGTRSNAVLLTSAMVTVAELIVLVAFALSTAGSQVSHHQPAQPKGISRREGGSGSRVTPERRRKYLHGVQSYSVVGGQRRE